MSDGTVSDWSSHGAPVQVGARRSGFTSSVIALSTDGNLLAGLDRDGHIVVWDSVGRRSPAALETTQHDSPVLSIAYSLDNTLASGTQDGTVRVRTRDGWQTVLRLSAGISGVAWQATGQLAVAAEDGSLRIVETADSASQVLRPPGNIPAVAVATNAGHIAEAFRDGQIVIFNRQRTERFLRTPITPVRSVALSPDGRFLAVGSGNDSEATVTLWSFDRRDAAPILLRGHSLQIDSLAFSPDGRTLASGSDDQVVRLWELPSGHPQAELRGHTDMIRALAFTPDSRIPASGGEDGTIRLWDIHKHQQIGQPLRADDGFIWALAASSDGRSLAAANANSVILWPLSVTSWIDHGCALAGRNLSKEEWAQYIPDQQVQTLCPGRPTQS